MDSLPIQSESEARNFVEITREAIRHLEITKQLPLILSDDSLAKELIVRVKRAALDLPRVKLSDQHCFRSLFILTTHKETRKRLDNLNAVEVLIQSLRVNVNSALVATLSNLAYEERAKKEIIEQHRGANLFVRLGFVSFSSQ